MAPSSLSDWTPLPTADRDPPPAPLTVRARTLAARSFFPEHRHDWGQVVYAIAGVLTVTTAGHSYVISPDQAVWVPPDLPHRVGTFGGAEFRSLWIDAGAADGLSRAAAVFGVNALLRALIVEAASLAETEEAEYRARVERLILDQLARAAPLPGALPWPRGERLNRLCQALYDDPADERSEQQWGKALAMSERTLRRRFESELGMSLRSWRLRMRLFKAVQLLGGGMDVTRTALELGYGSASAFIHAFRTGMGVSPQAYARKGALAPRRAETGETAQRLRGRTPAA